MWFKNAILYRLPENWGLNAGALETRLSARPIMACSAMQGISHGWGQPSGDGRFVVAVGGHLLASLVVEQKILPASVINERAAVIASETEALQGYKVGRKQMKEIKEAALAELLPKAFSKRRRTLVWIDPVGGWLVIDTSSPTRAEEVLNALRDALDEFPVRIVRTVQSPTSVMTAWLSAGEAPGAFTVDRDCKLAAVSDEKAKVSYAHHALDGSDVQQHLAAGKLPEALGMTFDERISFILTEKAVMKRLAFLDVVKAQAEEQADSADLQFEADFAIMSGEMSRLIPALIEALGGEAAPDLADSIHDVPHSNSAHEINDAAMNAALEH